MQNLSNPLSHVVHAVCVWGGLVLLWMGTFFFLSPVESRELYGLATLLLAVTCLVNYFAFGEGLGTISTTLVYDNGVHYSTASQLINLAAIAAVVALLAFVWKRANQAIVPALAITAAAVVALAVPNVLTINNAYADARERVSSNTNALVDANGNTKTIYHLSRTERNVVVLFLDRAISGYLPYIMAERPELEEKFDGFTYYPNTISFGSSTNFGAPALYGGYEYTPSAMDARADVSIKDKHNEALLVLPTLFSQAGYRSTIISPPYAGEYARVPDYSIYDGLDNLEAYNVEADYVDLLKEHYGITKGRDMNRTFVMYGLFKAEPEFLRGITYNDGNYLSTALANPPHDKFLNFYAALDYLPEATDVSDGAPGFIQICNETTHEADMLQLPDYLPAEYVDNTGLEDMSRFTLNGVTVRMDGSQSLSEMRLGHYHVNAAALLKLADYFDWMREEGVYDNTRIIIVSDHGRGLEQFDGWNIDEYMNVQNVNPLFMVKDFDAHGFTTSNDFMTNADVPTMALTDIVDNPVNPSTDVPITNDEKYAHDQLVTASLHWYIGNNRSNTFDTSDAPWYSVHDNIFDLSNWTRLEGGNF